MMSAGGLSLVGWHLLIHYVEDKLRAVVIFLWDSVARDSDYASGQRRIREPQGTRAQAQEV